MRARIKVSVIRVKQTRVQRTMAGENRLNDQCLIIISSHRALAEANNFRLALIYSTVVGSNGHSHTALNLCYEVRTKL